MEHSYGNQYFFELNHNDVLCGRGSGPNDRVGNIEFRNLVMTRKAEYLAAASRDAKGRIAYDIINAVRSRGGRFLRKLSPEQTTDVGFKRGTNVFELADVATVLEKTKQTLRNNRAEFVKENDNVVGANMGGSFPAPPINGTPCPEPTNDVSLQIQANPIMMDTKTSQEEPPSPHYVGFPSKPRIVSKSQGMKFAAPLRARPRVRISKFSKLVMIPYDDAQSKWYTREEQRLFYRTRLSDVRRLRYSLRNATPALTSEELLYECMGLGDILSPSVAHHVVNMKRAHNDVVLAAHRLHQGNNRIDTIAKISMISSRWARERAAEVAAIYAMSL
jgi:hypothetical protein